MKSGAFKIAAIYVIVGVLWIMLSDKLLFAMQNHFDLEFVLFISSIKGVAYVLLTGLLLYQLIKLHTRRISESELRYRSYFDDNPNPMWILDLRTFAFTAVNEAAIVFYGYSREEFLHMNMLDFCPPEDVAAVHFAARELQPGMNDNGVWRHIKKDGDIISVAITSHLIRKQKSGNIMAMIKERSTV
ncbi:MULTISPECIES: PAS domain S-box protein [unclassified Mucilaginibacter]|uniref:PAS domain S-box protein n=1 Tax=unclassified Mucilaginibacter TaxID=2617802 RepID=UPI002AC9A971|nr:MULTISPECIES: PAS domain S-box protein [unclassified Mucilaginibacter]MEB0261595.1 PAS domain S-box protein [Mucilaginibacter sp. 10I4]MEB0277151.1 PAS domain S-box protein [Mucilaginibacter sp. 10B2]MEB0301403.1 PAS domain S-box protein [Mucilaginibacter sp. 5C4]WPX25251.1 PAS domain S-box protein [Mucilaginibacter sp. 5C4]